MTASLVLLCCLSSLCLPIVVGFTVGRATQGQVSHRLTTQEPSLWVSTLTETERTSSWARSLLTQDLSNVEFVDSNTVKPQEENPDSPFAAMFHGSARYISQHIGQVAVMHIPGDIIETPEFTNLMNDIALAWTLGMKLVLVVGCRFDTDSCFVDQNNQGCHNSLPVTNDNLLRTIVEDSGFVRFEVERILNRFLRSKGTMSQHAPAVNGNVVGGNFYTALPFGVVDGVDYHNTGFATEIHTERIRHALDQNDVVLLSTVGSTGLGEFVNVNGQHLAASVAASMKARKLVFVSTKGCVLRKRGATKTMQDVPLGFVDKFLRFHDVHVNKAGFAAFRDSQQTLTPNAMELLLHLGWSKWALDKGTYRAHIVNPGDGALLEELFTVKDGVNTCVYHEDEAADLDVVDQHTVEPFFTPIFTIDGDDSYGA